MSSTLTYNLPNNLSSLHDELIAAGLVPITVFGDGDDITLEMEDGIDTGAVDAVVAAHIPAAASDPAADALLAAAALLAAQVEAEWLAGLTDLAVLAAAASDPVVLADLLATTILALQRLAGQVRDHLDASA